MSCYMNVHFPLFYLWGGLSRLVAVGPGLRRLAKFVLILALLAVPACGQAFEDTNILSAGDWSAPVAGFQDATTPRGAHHPVIRGWLVLGQSPKNHAAALYLELQECAGYWGHITEVYCNLEPGGGFRLVLSDPAGWPLRLGGGAFGGGMPGASWISLPDDATIRLRLLAFAPYTYASTNGYLVTNFHVVKDAGELFLILPAGTVPAEVVKVDEASDLALLMATRKFSALPVADSRKVKLGSPVMTVGFPNPSLLGFSAKFSKGDIAALAGAGDEPVNFQISVPIQPGNSGGALLDGCGNVFGIISQGIDEKTGA